MDLGLRDKRAIITGATKGIGRRILEQLIAEGCNVATCSRSIEDVEDVIEKCSTRKAEVIGAACDIKDKDEYKDWVDDMVARMEGVDIFIPNVSAGGGMDSEKNWWKNFETDVLGTVRGCEAVLPHMQEAGSGAITIIGTTAAIENVRCAAGIQRDESRPDYLRQAAFAIRRPRCHPCQRRVTGAHRVSGRQLGHAERHDAKMVRESA